MVAGFAGTTAVHGRGQFNFDTGTVAGIFSLQFREVNRTVAGILIFAGVDDPHTPFLHIVIVLDACVELSKAWSKEVTIADTFVTEQLLSSSRLNDCINLCVINLNTDNRRCSHHQVGVAAAVGANISTMTIFNTPEGGRVCNFFFFRVFL